MTTPDKLTEILSKYGQYPSTEREAEARSAIIDLFKSLVPEERNGPTGNALGIVPDLSDSFNKCRSQILSNIDSLCK